MRIRHTLTSIILAGFTTSVDAQSADNFQPVEQPHVASGQKDPSDVQMQVIDKGTESELLASPSRYAGLDLGNYVQALSSSFSMRSRDIDPFARHQDPTFKRPQPRPPKGRPKPTTKEPVIPFSEVLARINITAVMPSQQKFMVKGNSFRVGDRIKLDVGKDKHIPVHVIAIKQGSVSFRHGITGETSDLSLWKRPNGMTPGIEIKTPGMSRENNDTLILEAPPTNQILRR